MSYNIGDFIITYDSWKPSFIIAKEKSSEWLLVSIHEYMGDYTWIPATRIIKKTELSSEEKLSILANFGDWYYEQHKLLYQELIIEYLEEIKKI